jgi:hypothetical protein
MLIRAAIEVALGQLVADPLSRGISAADLAARANCRAYSVSAAGLQRWLLEHDLAVLVDGLLVPTALGRELGAALD